MIHFDGEYFQKIKFDANQIERLLQSAKRDLSIAVESIIPEVIFKFSYDALVKAGIFLIAKQGYKVKSRIGHHIKILEKMDEILGDEDIIVFGNKMRQERNIDLYSGGSEISEKDCFEYLAFVTAAIKKAQQK
ncbi:hypothetical protein HZC34_06105 [Candidatus Saganbacteria bacterium]|nr:hypothetical protein [Candidatus Saganbacteria bacterium]